MRLSKNFLASEFACRCGCGFDAISPLLVAALQELRDTIHVPIGINSGCRCLAHNAAEGGERNSYHLKGLAADIRVPKMRLYDLYRIVLRFKTFKGIGYYPAQRFLHVDLRPGKRVLFSR